MVSAGDLSLRETGTTACCPGYLHLLLPIQTSMLVLTQPAHSYSHVSMPTRAWLACVFKCPYLPSLVEACSYLFSPVQANTYPHLFMPIPACACSYLLSPVHVHTCPYLFTPALTCSHLPSLAHAHTCQSSTPPMSLRITSCFPTTLGLLFFLFQRLLSPSLSWLPASYPQSPLRMTLLCARARNLS